MKVLLITLMVFCSLSVFSQKYKVDGKTYSKGDQINDPNFAPYLGSWEWKDEDQYFKVKLTKVKTDLAGNPDFKAVLLIGGYQYKVNGTDKYNSLNVTDVEAANLGGGTIIGNRFDFNITDGTTHHRDTGTLQILSNGKMQWQIGEGRKEFKLKGQAKTSFSIPLNMILQKVAN